MQGLPDDDLDVPDPVTEQGDEDQRNHDQSAGSLCYGDEIGMACGEVPDKPWEEEQGHCGVDAEERTDEHQSQLVARQRITDGDHLVDHHGYGNDIRERDPGKHQHFIDTERRKIELPPHELQIADQDNQKYDHASQIKKDRNPFKPVVDPCLSWEQQVKMDQQRAQQAGSQEENDSGANCNGITDIKIRGVLANGERLDVDEKDPQGRIVRFFVDQVKAGRGDEEQDDKNSDGDPVKERDRGGEYDGKVQQLSVPRNAVDTGVSGPDIMENIRPFMDLIAIHRQQRISR